jgi:DNA invertase Pin-like site-specific DNA recombinase
VFARFLESARALNGEALLEMLLIQKVLAVVSLRTGGGELRAKGATLKATEQPIDTSTAAGKCFLDMLGVFAEFETNLRRERQLEGIAAAKKAGVYKGRPATIKRTDLAKLRPDGLGATEIAKRLRIARASVYRVAT